jgi:hypothetical protein
MSKAKIREMVDHFGGPVKFAEVTGYSRQIITYWTKADSVPSKARSHIRDIDPMFTEEWWVPKCTVTILDAGNFTIVRLLHDLVINGFDKDKPFTTVVDGANLVITQ